MLDRHSRRAWRSSAFRIQALAVLLAAFTLTAMLQLHHALDARFSERTATTLGGDLVLEGSQPPTPAQRQVLQGVRHAQTVGFASVLINENHFLLASIEAVSDSYPLYGQVIIANSRFAEGEPVSGGPPAGHLWLAGTALDRLGLAVGEFITLGEKTFLIGGVLVQEPDQQSGFYSMNPRVLMNLKDLPATGVLATGSRYKQRLLIAAPAPRISALAITLSDGLRPDQTLENAADSSLQQRGPVRQLFLWSRLAVMLILLLCAAAIYLTAALRAHQQQRLSAVMKTVGARRGQLIRRIIVGEMLPLLWPALIGTAMALMAMPALLSWLGMPLADGRDQWQMALGGLASPLLLWAGYALPPLWQRIGLPTVALLREQVVINRRQRLLTLLLAIATPLPLAWLLAGSLMALWPLLLVMAAVAVGLPLLLWPLVSLADRASGRLSLAARLALRRFSRRRAMTLPLLAALTVALATMTLSLHTGQQLIQQWRSTLPEQAPNYFVINIFDQDLPELRRWLTAHGSQTQPLYPITRARLTLINQTPVREAVSKENDRGQRALNRDLSLTEADALPQSNTLLSGTLATAAGEVTVESRLAESLDIQIGDQLTFTAPQQTIDARVTGIREVNWESFAPNFYFMFAPGSLGAQNRTWLTSFYLPPGNSAALTQLVQQFPHLSLLDVNALLNTLQSLISQASQAALALALLLLVAALLVLAAALLATGEQRRKDNRLLVLVGARQGLLKRINGWQAWMLGGTAALLANLLHLLALIPLGQLLFDGRLPLSPWLALPWALALVVTAVALIRHRGAAGQ
ncbi:ABC transporter permease [Alcanivorax hongdengensis A-11-3]|uniref:ABC transporter permease n=1 Tax=Alcanivorax hongdengensis A-11-3 TaxID=1177179 RepID=L0WBC7_9GAMM|nr:ABC transporter permease [Alcanivorax hongdengensis]EKF74073.1 ABC transporter permease [Alcanivorax hongdengensis A-11-3]